MSSSDVLRMPHRATHRTAASTRRPLRRRRRPAPAVPGVDRGRGVGTECAVAPVTLRHYARIRLIVQAPAREPSTAQGSGVSASDPREQLAPDQAPDRHGIVECPRPGGADERQRRAAPAGRRPRRARRRARSPRARAARQLGPQDARPRSACTVAAGARSGRPRRGAPAGASRARRAGGGRRRCPRSSSVATSGASPTSSSGRRRTRRRRADGGRDQLVAPAGERPVDGRPADARVAGDASTVAAAMPSRAMQPYAASTMPLASPRWAVDAPPPAAVPDGSAPLAQELVQLGVEGRATGGGAASGPVESSSTSLPRRITTRRRTIGYPTRAMVEKMNHCAA